MLNSSDRPIEEVLAYFTAHDLEAGFLVPTPTGLRKGIMDAHSELRDYLRATGIHDFAAQPKGTEHKVQIAATFLGQFDDSKATVSLYRPETKGGDPRIWIYGLPKWAVAGNLLALFVVDGHLFITNTSNPEIWDARHDPDSPLGDIVTSYQSNEDVIASELLDKLYVIAKKGWIPSLKGGDTGIGYTLESLLGIAANSSKAPDYQGIELKSSRKNSSKDTLFSQVPDWAASPVSKADLLARYGKPMHYQVEAKPNSIGLYMATDHGAAICRDADHEDLLRWPLANLRSRLETKHRSTFWIGAKATVIGGVEHFQYESVTHTRSPIGTNFGPLIQEGKVEVHLLLGRSSGGDCYNFRMKKSHKHLLFPPPKTYSLV